MVEDISAQFISMKTLIQYRKLVWSTFLEVLATLLTLWTVVELCIDEISICCKISVAIGVVILSVIIALCKIMHHPESKELEINNRTKLIIEKGDIFDVSKNSACVIPVNDYFDTHLGNGIINSSTIHGKFLKRFEGRIPQLRKDIDAQLAKIQPLPVDRTRTQVPGLPQKRYPLGTYIRIFDDEQVFILVAASRFNKDEHPEVVAEEYPEMVRKMYKGIENLHDGRTVYLPLIGSGLSGYGLTNMQMLNTLVQAAYNADKLAITEGIRIRIYTDNDWKSLNLNVIEYLFDRWKTLK